MSRSSFNTTRHIWVPLVFAVLAYSAALLAGAQASLTGAALSSIATAALGAALVLYTAGRVAAAPEQRLGARAQAARRRYRTLAITTAGVVYLVLVFGAVVANSGGLWDCLALPICLNASDAALLGTAHRGFAAFATLLVAVLAFITWRSRPEVSLRTAASWAFGLILAQNMIGLIQVLAASGENAFTLTAVRLAHLSIGALTWGALVVLATLAVRLPFPQEHTTRNKQQASGGATEQRGLTDTLLLSAPVAATSNLSSLIKDYVSLTKPGVITLLIFTTITSMYITPAGTPELSLVLWTALGGWLMASGSHALNCYFDRDIDLLMGRTGRRPIPSGRIPPWHALVLGIGLGVVAFAILVVFVNWAAALLSLAGLLYYVIIYTLWLKRTSWNNIVIGGGAGAFPPLVGWAAITGSLTLPSLLLFAIIFYWTPPHFWALAIIRQKDYARAGVPMLPVVAGDAHTKWQIVLYTIMLLSITILPTPLGMLGLPYLLMALVLGGILLYYAVRLMREDTTAAAWGLYRFSLLYLALLFAAMVVDRLVFA